jgi:hypothetical protein
VSKAPVKITIVMPADVAAMLSDYAKQERRSRSNAACVLLEEALQDHGVKPSD